VKKSFYIAVLFALRVWGFCWAQGPSTTDRYIPQTPPSWNATSILASAYKATGLYTGTTDVAVPIYTIQSRKLSLPIALRYEPGGVKVTRMASWVGLNWSLEAGGVIGRVAQGAYDTYTTTAGQGTYQNGAEPDVFHFSFLGRSGRFVLFTNGGATVWRTMPNSNLRITPTWSTPNGAAQLTGFTLVDEGGTVYEFTALEQTQIAINGSAPDPVQNTAWYLTRIRPYDFSDEITLTYEAYSLGAQFLARGAKHLSLGSRYHTADAVGLPLNAPTNHSASSCAGCPISASSSYDTLYVTQALTSGRRLQRITFVNGYVDFIRSTTARPDLPGDFTLDTIKVVQTYWGPGKHKLIAQWKLDYGQFAATAGPGRLKLTRVRRLYVEAGQSKSLNTTFSYNETAALPPRVSFNQDLWGYFNGASNTSFAPGIANRDTLGSAARRGILLSVATPLGAETHYSYESHAADAMVGGQRIRRIEVRPNASPTDTGNIIKSYVYAVPGTLSWVQPGLKISGTGAAQHGRTAISADGNTLLVGGTADASNQGAVWAYTRNGTGWTFQHKLTPTNNNGPAVFGFSVALSADGNTAVIGGIWDSSNVGAAWVYVRSGSSWSFQQKLVGTHATAGQQGHSVAISADGNTVLFGGLTDNSNTGAGWVWVRSGTVWTQQARLVSSDGSAGRRIGFSCALSADGNTAVLGGPNDSSNEGGVWVFVRSGTTWSQQSTRIRATTKVGAAFQGISCALSGDGNTLAFGGQADSSNHGAVWVFTRSGSTWTQGPKLKAVGASGAAGFGWSVSMAGDANTLAIGGFWDNSNVGAAWVFVRNGSAWVSQSGRLVGTVPVGPGQQGRVALSGDGNTLVSGSHGDNSNQGAVWTFVRSAPSLTTGLRLTVPSYYDLTLWKVLTPAGCSPTPPTAAPRLACGTRVQASYSHTDFWSEANVEYTRVEENLGSTGQYGRSVFTYTSRVTSGCADLVASSFVGALPTLREWRRGLLLTTAQLDVTVASAPAPVAEGANEISYFDTPINHYRSQAGATNASFSLFGDVYARSGSYTLESGWYATTQTISRSYTQDSPPVVYADTTRYRYSPQHLHLTEQEVLRGAGIVHGSLFLYSDSSRYDSTATTSDTQLGAIWRFRRLNMRSVPVETIAYQRLPNSTSRSVLSASLSKFQLSPSLRGSSPRPFESLGVNLESPLALTSFTTSSCSGSLFNVDTRYPTYNQGGRIAIYDAWGLPLTSTDNRNVTSQIVYGYNNTAPIFSITNSDTTQFAYSSFELSSRNAWLTSAASVSAVSYSGQRSHPLHLDSLRRNAVPNGRYYVSFWARSVQGQTSEISITGTGVRITVNDSNWKHVILPVNIQAGKASIKRSSGSSNVFVDEVRLQPLESNASSIVMEPLIGVTSAFNAQNIPMFTEYDFLNRAYLTKDQNRDILRVQSFKIKQQ